MNRVYLALIFIFVASACNRPAVGVWEEFCVRTGSHDFKPSPLIINNDANIAYEWKFTPSMRYDLDGSDQCDWNKLTGVSWNLLNNHKDAFMVAWRWHLDGYWQVAAYYHDEGRTFWADAPCTYANAYETDPAIPVSIVYPDESGGGYFQTHIDIQETTGHASVTILADETTFFEHYFGVEPGQNYREIGAWFGGDEVAPHSMCLQRKRIK